MVIDHELLAKAQAILEDPEAKADVKSAARRYLFQTVPLSRLIEIYLYDNEGRPQSLDQFQMMRPIYDSLPQKLLLKCSRKTLKSTLLSNMLALNIMRYQFYKMLYVAPQELSAKYFSNNYLDIRFDSPPLKRIIQRFTKRDVFEKVLADTGSSVILRYCKEDASRLRGPATDHNVYDEVQDIAHDALPIIKETMALSAIKREYFAGTPLTTDNTINELWKTSNQCEWMTKCTGCNHWNSLTFENDPISMIRPEGLSCSKCSTLLNTANGLWVSHNKHTSGLIGYHLAQPILPHFNSTPREWLEVYEKVHGTGPHKYSPRQVFNEVFGLAFDTGAKPITEEKLKQLCVLGELSQVHAKNSHRYVHVTCGVDWGVNMQTSRTAVCMGGLREDGVYEVFHARIYDDVDYEKHIVAIANAINHYQSFCACDSGPDAARGKRLGDLTSWQRTQMVRYENGALMQYYKTPAGSIHPAQNRWCLHRSDVMTFVFDLLKKDQVLFPNWEQSQECLHDVLNVFIEVKEEALRQELVYRHPADKPDDFFHALTWAVTQAHLLAGNQLLNSPSTSAVTEEWRGGAQG